jgi:hypothetical protein
VEVHWRAQHHAAAAAALAARRLTPAEWRRAIGSHLAAVVADGRDVRGAVRTFRATQDFAAARRVDAVCATDTGGAPGPDRRPLPRAGDHWPVWPRDPGPCRTALAHRLEPRHFSEPRCPRPCSARSVGTPFRRLDDALGRWCRWSFPARTWPLPIGCSARARRCARDRTTRTEMTCCRTIAATARAIITRSTAPAQPDRRGERARRRPSAVRRGRVLSGPASGRRATLARCDRWVPSRAGNQRADGVRDAAPSNGSPGWRQSGKSAESGKSVARLAALPAASDTPRSNASRRWLPSRSVRRPFDGRPRERSASIGGRVGRVRGATAAGVIGSRCSSVARCKR